MLTSQVDLPILKLGKQMVAILVAIGNGLA